MIQQNQTRLEKYQTLVGKKLTPMPDKQDTPYDVQFTLCADGHMLAEYANVEFEAIRAYYKDKNGGEPGFTLEDFKKYINTLVFSRIQWVRGRHYIIHPNDKVAVPAFLSVVLMNIGRAEETSLGISLLPDLRKTDDVLFRIQEFDAREEVRKQEWEVQHSVEGVEGEFRGASDTERNIAIYSLLSKDEMFIISRHLKSINGYQYSDGYLKDRFGTFDFMAMQMVGDYVMRHESSTHPVYGLLSSILEPHLVCSALSPLVRYGNKAYLRGLLWEVVAV